MKLPIASFFDMLLPLIPFAVKVLPVHERYVYEPKWDGIRALIYVNPDGVVRVRSRNGHDISDKFPELNELQKTVTAPCIIDGEIICLNDAGIPDFSLIIKRNHKQWVSTTPKATLVAFDLLMLDHQPLIDQVWSFRREQLVKTVHPIAPFITISPHYDDGVALFTATKEMELEGVVIKEKDGTYHPGVRHKTWQKIRHLQTISVSAFAIVFFERHPRSLLLSLLDDPTLYLGRVGSGIAPSVWDSLSKHTSSKKPASTPHFRLAQGESVLYLKDPITVAITYLEWTAQHTLRQPVFQHIVKGLDLS